MGNTGLIKRAKRERYRWIGDFLRLAGWEVIRIRESIFILVLFLLL